MSDNDDSPFGDAVVDSGENRQTRTGSAGSSETVSEVLVQGEYGVKLYTEGMSPELGDGDIAYVAEYEGAIDFKDDAILGPVAVGDEYADEFREELEDRVDDVVFHDFQE